MGTGKKRPSGFCLGVREFGTSKQDQAKQNKEQIPKRQRAASLFLVSFVFFPLLSQHNNEFLGPLMFGVFFQHRLKHPLPLCRITIERDIHNA